MWAYCCVTTQNISLPVLTHGCEVHSLWASEIRDSGIILGIWGRIWNNTGEKCAAISFIFVFSPDYWGDEIKQKETRRVRETRGRELHAGNWLGKVKERGHVEDLEIHGSVIVNKVSNIIKRHIDNRELLFICILLLWHPLIFFKFLFFINIWLYSCLML